MEGLALQVHRGGPHPREQQRDDRVIEEDEARDGEEFAGAEAEETDRQDREAQKHRQRAVVLEVIDDERAGDGMRLELEDAMFVVRYSQNGPYLTIKFEAKTKSKYERLREYISAMLHEFKEIDWESEISANVEALAS